MKNRFMQPLAFALFLFFIWAMVFMRYLAVYGFTPDFSFVFSCIFALGHAGEFAVIALVIMLALAFLPRFLAGALSIGLGAAITIVFVANFFAYKQFRIHIDLALMSMFFGEAGGDIFVFPPIMYVQATLAVLVMLGVAAAGWFLSRRICTSARARSLLKKGYVLLLASVLAFHGIHAWASFNMYSPVLSQISALPLAQPLSANSTLRKMGFEPAKDLPRLKARAMNYPLAELKFVPTERPLNVVTILLDGWRYDCLSEEISPNIYALSRQSQRFNNHNSASNHTRHGVFSFIYGLPGSYWGGALAGRIGPVLISSLLEHNYAMGIWGSSPLSSPEFDRTAFVDVPNLETHVPGDEAPARDLAITEKFLRFIDDIDPNRPFFSFLFYDSTHSYTYDHEIFAPKFLPEDSKNYFSGDKNKYVPEFNRYKNSIGYVDVLVGRVLDALKERGLLENTVVIVTGDHGEEFDDAGLGYSGHNGNFSRYQVHVPMIVYWPGREAADHDYLTSHLDVAPTLMQEVLGVLNPPRDYSNGASLFTHGREYAFAMGPSGSYGIQVGDVVTVFPPAGPSYAVSYDNYRPVDWKLPPELYRTILNDLSRFKR